MTAAGNETVGRALARAVANPGGAARADALALMRNALGFSDNAQVIANDRLEMDSVAREKFQADLQRRMRGEPTAYILGRREFYGREFLVNPSVLIPRPETELLVDLALEFLRDRNLKEGGGGGILDLATGSGAVGISIALEHPECEVALADLDAAALAVARENAKRLGAANASFRTGDFFAAVGDAERFDLLVCNPPYVAESDSRLAGDLRFEPRLALAAGADGLAALRIVIRGAADVLRPGGRMILEHGASQGAACRALAAAAGLAEAKTFRDLAGLERATCAVSPF